MRNRYMYIFTALCIFLLSANASAGLIVDPAWPDTRNAAEVSVNKWQAARFEVNAACEINSVKAFYSGKQNQATPSGTMHISIYRGDNAETRVPDTSALVHTELVTVPEIGAVNYPPNGDVVEGDINDLQTGIWFGPDFAQGVDLEPGAYWISFEVWGAPENGDDTYSGQLQMGFDDPLLDYALAVNLGVYDNIRYWKMGYDLDLGIKIEASSNPTPTPLPGAIWLLGTGLIGLIGIKRRTIE